jgi:hypothetical protein
MVLFLEIFIGKNMILKNPIDNHIFIIAEFIGKYLTKPCTVKSISSAVASYC